MGDKEIPIGSLKEAVEKFNSSRNWEKYHNPKDLAMSVSIESAELLENFQWKTVKESDELNEDDRAKVEDEIADVAIYLIALCNRMDIDLSDAVIKKIERNEKRF